MSNPDSTGETFDLERTWLVSVLFVDMIKYSQQSQETQAQWRFAFQGLCQLTASRTPLNTTG